MLALVDRLLVVAFQSIFVLLSGISWIESLVTAGDPRNPSKNHETQSAFLSLMNPANMPDCCTVILETLQEYYCTKKQSQTLAPEKCRTLSLSPEPRRIGNPSGAGRANRKDARRSEYHGPAVLNAQGDDRQWCRRCCRNRCLPAQLRRLPGTPQHQ